MKIENFRGMEKTNSLIRREFYNEEEYLVFASVSLVEGVHNRLFYPLEEIKRSVEVWNGRPVCIEHPVREGVKVSSNLPETLQESIGYIFNSRIEEGKLKMEVWVNVRKAGGLGVLELLEEGRNVEVSVGLHLDTDGKPGEWRGEQFDAMATNFHPDHLAILISKEGACNWKDGCGLRMNSKGPWGTSTEKAKSASTEKVKLASVRERVKKAERKGVLEDRLSKAKEAAKRAQEEADNITGSSQEEAEGRADRKRLRVKEIERELKNLEGVLIEEVEDIYSLLRSKLQDIDSRSPWGAISNLLSVEEGEGFFIFERNGCLYKTGFVIGDMVEFDGEPIRVVQVVSYEPWESFITNSVDISPEVLQLQLSLKEVAEKYRLNRGTPLVELDREYYAVKARLEEFKTKKEEENE